MPPAVRVVAVNTLIVMLISSSSPIPVSAIRVTRKSEMIFASSATVLSIMAPFTESPAPAVMVMAPELSTIPSSISLPAISVIKPEYDSITLPSAMDREPSSAVKTISPSILETVPLTLSPLAAIMVIPSPTAVCRALMISRSAASPISMVPRLVFAASKLATSISRKSPEPMPVTALMTRPPAVTTSR